MQGHTAGSGERFVPKGVDEQSWIGFEQRIQERRFRVLLGTIRASIAAGDMVAARHALDEARELVPDSGALVALESKIPDAIHPARPAAARPSRWRAGGALLLLACGVSLLTLIDYSRAPRQEPERPATPAPPPLAAAAPAPEQAIAVPPDPITADVTSQVEPLNARAQNDAVPAARIPIGTSGLEVKLDGDVSVPASLQPVAAPAATEPAPPPEPVERTVTPASPADSAPAPGAVSTSPAARPAAAAATTAALASPPAGSSVPAAPVAASSLPPQPSAVVQLPPPRSTVAVPSAATPRVSPAAPPSTIANAPGADEARVADVLNAYARAYNNLDAVAAHQVWPGVDERALARAFSSLSAQTISFADCRISVRDLTATAACRGYATYVGRIGARSARTEPRQWHFDLRRAGQGWTIDRAETSR
jgi:hypothetical protein